MEIVRLTSPLPVMHRVSSPRPRLRNSRRLALLSRLNSTLNLCTLSFVLSLAFLSHLSPLLISPTVPLPEGVSFGLHRLPEIPLFCIPATDLRSRARGYFFEHRQITCPEESHSFSCSLFSSTEFLAAATNFFSFTATGPDKVVYPMSKHLPRFGMAFLLHIFNIG